MANRCVLIHCTAIASFHKEFGFKRDNKDLERMFTSAFCHSLSFRYTCQQQQPKIIQIKGYNVLILRDSHYYSET